MRGVITLLMVMILSMNAQATIQDYQIIRLIAMDSDCNLEELERLQNKDDTLSFIGSCSNVSHYPEGITIYCPDVENERSCKIKTDSLQFDNLKLLQKEEDG